MQVTESQHKISCCSYSKTMFSIVYQPCTQLFHCTYANSLFLSKTGHMEPFSSKVWPFKFFKYKNSQRTQLKWGKKYFPFMHCSQLYVPEKNNLQDEKKHEKFQPQI